MGGRTDRSLIPLISPLQGRWNQLKTNGHHVDRIQVWDVNVYVPVLQ